MTLLPELGRGWPWRLVAAPACRSAPPGPAGAALPGLAHDLNSTACSSGECQSSAQDYQSIKALFWMINLTVQLAPVGLDAPAAGQLVPGAGTQLKFTLKQEGCKIIICISLQCFGSA